MSYSVRTLRLLALGGATVAALAASATATAASPETTTLSVSASVSADCDITTTAVSFGAVAVLSSTADDANGSLSVTCTSGTAWTAKADKGLGGTTATLTDRKMQNSTNLLSYDLYTDAGYTKIWGDAADTTTVAITGTGDGSTVAHTIYGRVPTGQKSAALGTYADTVTVTITY